jgi:UDP-N-acetylmuramate--alanine ligase
MYELDDLPMHNVRRVHFIGIGGAGMSGIAEVLNNLGYDVSGSDIAQNRMTRHLASIGVTVYDGHDPGNVDGADVVVYSSAIADENSELATARLRRLPVVPRAEMLAELMRFKRGIAVAGTHGKTTTTSLIASVLAEGGLDPTFVIGGRLNSVDSHARLGSGPYLVAEADESDASFLLLLPLAAVLTNIDADHMSTYAGDFDRLEGAFVEFFRRLPFYGIAFICVDDPRARSLISELHTRVLTYGIAEDADIRGYDIVQGGGSCRFRIARKDRPDWLRVTLNMPGRHNVLNALAAVAVGHEFGVNEKSIVAALERFQGIDRRSQVIGDCRIGAATVTVIDDYGHHPSEIAAMLQTIREGWPGRRVLVAFQPHRYTRTRDLFEDFAQVLSEADALVVLDVYAAGEKAIAGADSRTLCRAIRLRGRIDPVFVGEVEELFDTLAGLVDEADVVLLSGAGSIGRVAEVLRREHMGAAG